MTETATDRAASHATCDAVIDLGRSRCRVLLRSRPELRAEGRGAPGLASRHGVSVSLDASLDVLGRLTPAAGGVRRLVAGVPGTLGRPKATAELAVALAARARAQQVAVTDAAVLAHLGALGGGPGVVVVPGTDALTVGINEEGDLVVVDGFLAGAEDGDLGSGAWIAGEALRRAADGALGLRARAAARFGDWTTLARTTSHESAARRARLVPDVVELADDGDADARAVLDEAAGHLARTARGVVDRLTWRREPVVVVLVPGLHGLGTHLRDHLAEKVAPAVVRTPRGSALDGGVQLLERGDLPHERWVTRSPAAVGTATLLAPAHSQPTRSLSMS